MWTHNRQLLFDFRRRKDSVIVEFTHKANNGASRSIHDKQYAEHSRILQSVIAVRSGVDSAKTSDTEEDAIFQADLRKKANANEQVAKD
jgi:hypothetical protein